MLHAQIGEDEGYFTIDDVIQGLSEKMVRRHPHVFGNVQADNEEEVLKNWQSIKQEEKGEKQEFIMDHVPKAFPNLMRAAEIQKKAAKVGFDWKEVEPAWEKVKEEISEFESEARNKSSQMEAEFGDILFALVNIARFYKIDAEEATRKTNEKFIRRFSYVEERVKESGRNFEDYTLEQLDEYWNEAKAKGY
jgi:tetrapyrrole methylase family protein/MazG family protein